ncbi:PspC domain-containing protein [Pseudarthrobacter phenanthrenivorans]|uniref:PspC domain-containing protein n=2 Tax=Pseudarthrobacter phenanthrenivorans TaxID=361575 RepID=A0A3B0FFX7_PSEPS|nr:PspC domain-containing protein [Pseudarthrobacter phenanthrenivorans]ADX73960.1 putative stress-responsive transcriptional regulator [Pseudarthrobacter phenanthrenivorans Sphe3]RKO25506.1 PspC domain-containing protein [Pseudarthrobacter phenanthrenivorans]
MNPQTTPPNDSQPAEPPSDREKENPTEPLSRQTNPTEPLVPPPSQPVASQESGHDFPQDPPPQNQRPQEPPTGGSYAPGGSPDPGAPHTGVPQPGVPHQGVPQPGIPHQQTDFFTWVRSQGIVRGQDRWVGGVSSGIAQRLGIDPLIVRGVFIILALFAGIGVLFYGLAWAFLPEPDGRIHVQEAGAGRWTSGMTGSLIAVVLGFSGLGNGFWVWGNQGVGPFLWTVLWVGGAIYLIYYLVQRNKTAAGTPSGAASGTTAYSASSTAYSSGTTGTATPPYSDVAGSGPFAGNPYGGATASGGSGGWGTSGYGTSGYGGSRPSPVPPPAPRPRPAGPGTPAVAVAAGSALLVGAGLKALDITNVIDLGDSANAVAWASAAAVLGLGILILGLRGRTSGILSFFAVAALITGGIFNVVGNNGERVRFQQVDWTPTSIQQASDGFDITAGSGTVDLTEMNLEAPLESEVRVPLDITASNVTVVIPDDVPVDIRADMTMGNLTEQGNQRGGITTRESSYNTDQPGSHLVIQIHGTVSNVTIQEGN